MSYIQNVKDGIGGCPRDFVRKHAKIEAQGLPKYVRTLAVTRFKEILRRTGNVLRDVNGDPVKVPPSVFDIFEVLMMHFHNEKTGQCNPRAKKIAKEVGCDPRTVTRANKIFEKIGLLKCLKTTYNPNKEQRKKLPPKARNYEKVRGSNRYHLVKGVIGAMFEMIERLNLGGRFISFLDALGLKDIAKKKKTNKFSKPLDQKKHDLQQELFAFLDAGFEKPLAHTDNPRDGCGDYIDNLPMAPVRPNSDPVQKLLARRPQGAV